MAKTPAAGPAPKASLPAFLRFSGVMVLIALFLFLVSSVLWWKYVYSDPHRVFEAMLNNSLRLRGVTRRVSQTENGETITQVSQIVFDGNPRVTAETVLAQGDGVVATEVVTEGMGTPTTDYVRYTSIDTNQPGLDGQPLDFTSVLNIWSKSSEGDKQPPKTNGELYNETVLGVVPLGLLTQSQRDELTAFMKQENIYDVDYDHVEQIEENGRPRYVYHMTVDAQGYVRLLKKFAEITGLNHLDVLDPSAYAQAGPLPFSLTVDVRSRQLTKVDYGGTGRTEELMAHNALPKIELPSDTITTEELQQRLQELQ